MVQVFDKVCIYRVGPAAAGMSPKEETVPKARIRNGELTIPLSDEIREKLGVGDGDELEAHVFSGSLVLTASAEARERAWQRIFAITAQVRPTPAQAAKPIEQVEDEIVECVKETRRALRAAARNG
jgi:bifunctional DNA-binding transcriptional regulator/antitoxin component of YhaV-PrlF toxin-antitoxin module